MDFDVVIFVVKHLYVLNVYLSDKSYIKLTCIHSFCRITSTAIDLRMFFSIFFTKSFLLSFFIKGQLAWNDLCDRPGVNTKTFSSCSTCI